MCNVKASLDVVRTINIIFNIICLFNRKSIGMWTENTNKTNCRQLLHWNLVGNLALKTFKCIFEMTVKENLKPGC